MTTYDPDYFDKKQVYIDCQEKLGFYCAENWLNKNEFYQQALYSKLLSWEPSRGLESGLILSDEAKKYFKYGEYGTVLINLTDETKIVNWLKYHYKKNVACTKCHKKLFTFPKITFINDETPETFHERKNAIYCFKCAKRHYVVLQKEKAASEQQKRLKYDEEFALNKQKIDDWGNEYRKYVYSNRLEFGSYIIIYLSIVVIAMFLHQGLAGLVAIGLVPAMLFTRLHDTEKKQKEFEKLRKKPSELKKYCSNNLLNKHFPLEYQVVKHDNYQMPRKSYREDILKRDDFTCQNCGLQKSKPELEAHHIIPRSKQGKDHCCNLITLCVDCHDKESWFDHFRAYKRNQ